MQSVVRRMGLDEKADYAMTIIAMKSQTNYSYSCSSYSIISGKSASEEKIEFIMKIKKQTTAALILACVVVASVAGAFATSADDGVKNNTKITNVDVSEEGITAVYSDGTKETPDTSAYSEIEWWTADKYEAWFNEQRVELPKIIGERGWTPSTGWFE